MPDIAWEEVIPELEYPFAGRGISIGLKHLKGDPKRRRFGKIKRNHDGFTWISLNFRKECVNIYTKVNIDQGTERIKALFGDDIEINEWRDGISFLIRSEEESDKVVEWLKL